MIFAMKETVRFDAPPDQLMAELTTAAQEISTALLEDYSKKLVKDMFETAHTLLMEEIENGGK